MWINVQVLSHNCPLLQTTACLTPQNVVFTPCVKKILFNLLLTGSLSVLVVDTPDDEIDLRVNVMGTQYVRISYDLRCFPLATSPVHTFCRQ